MAKKIERLINDLSHETYLVRREAFDALNQINTFKVKDALLGQLDHSESHVRIAAIKLLSKHEGNDIVVGLLKALHADQKEALEAAEALGSFDTPHAIEGLCKALSHASSRIGSAAAHSLGKIGNPTAIECLNSAIEQGHTDVQVAAAFALGAFEDERAVEALFKALKNRKWKVHAQAFNSLCAMDNLEGLEPYAFELTRQRIRVLNGKKRLQDLLNKAQKTKTAKTYLCTDDFMRFAEKRSNGFTHLGCRECGKTENSTKVKEAIAVLDTTMKELFYTSDDKGYVNWFKHKKLFDFDTLVIGTCDEDDIEVFCIEVANDTDPLRAARYPDMKCLVKHGVELSGRIQTNLKNIFGEVVLG